MEKRKHKKNARNQVIIMTSDAADAPVKQLRIRSPLLFALILIVCAVIGAVIGYFFNEGKIREIANKKADVLLETVEELKEEINQLEEDKEALYAQISDLEDEISELTSANVVLSDTVNQKTDTINQLTAELENLYIPVDYPLTGSAKITEEGEDICVFEVSEGSTVVATASGTVSAINDDMEYGHSVWIDHGNGYITIYRNQGDVIVNLGDTVASGTTIFVIDSDNTDFGYQIIKDDSYINPMDMLSISG